MIATLGETTGYPGLLWMKRKMEADTVGRLILQLVQLLSYCSWMRICLDPVLHILNLAVTILLAKLLVHCHWHCKRWSLCWTLLVKVIKLSKSGTKWIEDDGKCHDLCNFTEMCIFSLKTVNFSELSWPWNCEIGRCLYIVKSRKFWSADKMQAYWCFSWYSFWTFWFSFVVHE